MFFSVCFFCFLSRRFVVPALLPRCRWHTPPSSATSYSFLFSLNSSLLPLCSQLPRGLWCLISLKLRHVLFFFLVSHLDGKLEGWFRKKKTYWGQEREKAASRADGAQQQEKKSVAGLLLPTVLLVVVSATLSTTGNAFILGGRLLSMAFNQHTSYCRAMMAWAFPALMCHSLAQPNPPVASTRSACQRFIFSSAGSHHVCVDSNPRHPQ